MTKQNKSTLGLSDSDTDSDIESSPPYLKKSPNNSKFTTSEHRKRTIIRYSNKPLVDAHEPKIITKIDAEDNNNELISEIPLILGTIAIVALTAGLTVIFPVFTIAIMFSIGISMLFIGYCLLNAYLKPKQLPEIIDTFSPSGRPKVSEGHTSTAGITNGLSQLAAKRTSIRSSNESSFVQSDIFDDSLSNQADSSDETSSYEMPFSLPRDITSDKSSESSDSAIYEPSEDDTAEEEYDLELVFNPKLC